MSSLAQGHTASDITSIQTWGSLIPNSALLTFSFTSGERVLHTPLHTGGSILFHLYAFALPVLLPRSYFFSLGVGSYRFFMGLKYFLRRQIIDFANPQ